MPLTEGTSVFAEPLCLQKRNKRHWNIMTNNSRVSLHKGPKKLESLFAKIQQLWDEVKYLTLKQAKVKTHKNDILHDTSPAESCFCPQPSSRWGPFLLFPGWWKAKSNSSIFCTSKMVWSNVATLTSSLKHFTKPNVVEPGHCTIKSLIVCCAHNSGPIHSNVKRGPTTEKMLQYSLQTDRSSAKRDLRSL